MSDLEPTPRTTLRRLPERGHFDRADRQRDPRRGAWSATSGFVRRRPALRDPHHLRAGSATRCTCTARAASRMLQDAAGRRARLRHRHPPGRPGAGPLRLPPLDELPLGRGARGRRRRSGTARRSGTPCTRSSSTSRPGAGPRCARRATRSSRPRWSCACPSRRPRPRSAPGRPVDDEEDYALPCWAGVLPLRLDAGHARVAGPAPARGRPLPPSVTAIREAALDFQRVTDEPAPGTVLFTGFPGFIGDAAAAAAPGAVAAGPCSAAWCRTRFLDAARHGLAHIEAAPPARPRPRRRRDRRHHASPGSGSPPAARALE